MSSDRCLADPRVVLENRDRVTCGRELGAVYRADDARPDENVHSASESFHWMRRCEAFTGEEFAVQPHVVIATVLGALGVEGR